MEELYEIPVSRLRGVGHVKELAYAAAGVHSILDLLYYFPRAYENRGHTVLLADTDPEAKCATILTVATEPRVHNIKRGMSLLKLRAFDESGSCEITYFNQSYLKDKFPIGSTFRFYGKVEHQKGRYLMTSPTAEAYTPSTPLPPLVPVYRLSEGLSQKQIAQNVHDVLPIAASAMADPLPESIRIRYKLCTIYYALRQIHEPESYEALSIAMRRLIFDEFFIFAIGLRSSSRQIQGLRAPRCRKVDMSPLLDLLPYDLTGAQARTISEISQDLEKDEPMSRIIIGDVGCGKTVCAVAAIYTVVKNGYQAALMAPTEILASQHYNDISKLLSVLGIKTALLTGSVTASEKARIYDAMKTDDPQKRVDVVIGTQALLSNGAEFASPGLVITDEQHRFGVNQRALLSQKNSHTHMLVMSATPIPRSLALVMYGDLKMSKIDEMPSGRQRVETFLVDESYRSRLDAFICKNVDSGGQVYIVCPTVEEKEDGEIDTADILCGGDVATVMTKRQPMKAAVQYADELSKRLGKYTVAFVHGKMKPSEKDSIMKRFSCGEIRILVSTTVIEVGVNVPSACLMIVENAERFGLSQLHQLRGRVGRGSKKSYCVLVSEADGKLGSTANERLKTMCNCYNGFEIAEQDLKLRGPGDFLAMQGNAPIRQSGDVSFRLADACRDTDLMNEAFDAAKALVESDPTLSSYPLLKSMVERAFTVKSDLIS